MLEETPAVTWLGKNMASIWRTRVVGRAAELQEIDEVIQDPSRYSTLVFITGPGGIGKTVILRHIMENCPPGRHCLMTEGLIDLYHTHNQTMDGMIDRLAERLDPDMTWFLKYRAEKAKLDKMRAETPDQVDTLQDQIKRTIETFIFNYNQVAKKKRIVLEFDTAEKLIKQASANANLSDVIDEAPSLLTWLLEEFFPRLENTVVLMAGRPGIQDELKKIADRPAWNFKLITLKPLQADEVSKYFDSLADTIESASPPTANYIRNRLTEPERDQMFRIFCDYDEAGQPIGVRPIMLSLAIDYWTVAHNDLMALAAPLARVNAMTFTELQELRSSLETAFVQELAARDPIGKIILEMGLLTKGVDRELLERILSGTTQAEIDELLELLPKLSFIKVYELDGLIREERIFLHDELADLIKHRYWDLMQPTLFYEDLQKYYQLKINALREQVRDINLSVSYTSSKGSEKIIAIRERLLDAIVENIHYSLRGDLERGLQLYLLEQENGVTANDDDLSQQLRTELYIVLKEERGYAMRDRNVNRLAKLDDILHDWIEPYEEIRQVQRIYYKGMRDVAMRLAFRLLTEPQWTARMQKLAGLLLDAFVGAMENYRGDLSEALQRLQRVRTQLDDLPDEIKQLPFYKFVLARALNSRGLVYASQGKRLGANDAFNEALHYWKDLEMSLEYANTLGNLSFNLGRLGIFTRARRFANEVLNTRLRLAPRGFVALSLISLAQIHLLEGNLAEAAEFADKAYNLAFDYGYKRELGLALLMKGEVSRYRIESPLMTHDQKGEQFELAYQYCNEAYQIFTAPHTAEWSRAMEARFHQGQLLREYSHMGFNENEFLKLNSKCAINQSHAFFEDTARQTLEHKQIAFHMDVRVSEAWLYFHSHQIDEACFILDSLKELVRKERPNYEINVNHVPKPELDTEMDIFPMLARIHVLYGLIYMDRAHQAKYNAETHRNLLEKAAQEFILVYEYNTIRYEKSQGHIRSTNVIQNALEQLHSEDLRIIWKGTEMAKGRVLPLDYPKTVLNFQQLLLDYFDNSAFDR